MMVGMPKVSLEHFLIYFLKDSKLKVFYYDYDNQVDHQTNIIDKLELRKRHKNLLLHNVVGVWDHTHKSDDGKVIHCVAVRVE